MENAMIFLKDFFSQFSFEETVSSFIIMFMVIDMVGLTPVIIDMRTKGRDIDANKATIWSLVLFLVFLFLGTSILALFHVDVSSFAIAGSIVLFLMALEMVLDIEIFRNNGPAGSSTMIPLVFPLIAGAGSFTTLLSLQSLYSLVNILIGLAIRKHCLTNILFNLSHHVLVGSTVGKLVVILHVDGNLFALAAGSDLDGINVVHKLFLVIAKINKLVNLLFVGFGVSVSFALCR